MALFDDDTVAQHDQLIGQRAHDFQIMADEQVRQVVLGLQFQQQVDDLHLHRAVQRRGGFVEQHQFRLHDHRARDRDALALAAGEFVRIAEAARRVDADLVERGDDHFVARRLVADAVRDQPLLDDLVDRQPRAQRAVRILEHDLHLPPDRLQVLAAQVLDLGAVEVDPPLRLFQP